MTAYDLVNATFTNTDWDSTAAGKANVWLKEVDGADSTVCSWNNVYLQPEHHMACEDYNSSSNFDSHGKYTDLDGDWGSVQSQLE